MAGKKKKLPEVVEFDQLQYLQEENAKLKKKLDIIAKMMPAQLVISDEQAICEIEIARLKDIVMERVLTQEETKKFDILVKNLNGVKKDITIKAENIVDKMSITELIELVDEPAEETE